MEISLRLKAVAGMVHEKSIADIGTDHGYVPIYLTEKGTIQKAVACDINKGPLKKAEENIYKKGFEGIIETRMGNGLVPIKKGEVNCAVIAGMGGMLIIDILEKSAEVVREFKQLVLQPQLDVDRVRKYIHSIGFKIENEIFLQDWGKYYTIISAIRGSEKYDCEADYVFGRINIESKNNVLKAYVEKRLHTNQKIIENIVANSADKSEKICGIKKDISLCEGVLKRYEMQ